MEHLTRDQLLDVLAKAKAARERDWVLFLVSFWHGLRASEAINLTPEHFVDGYLAVQRLKGSLRTVQPLVEDENELLNERAAVEAWLTRHETAHHGSGRGKRLFPITRVQFYRLMRRYGRLAGLPKHLCHPHVLKHSIAMQSIKEAGIENVRQYLGHRSISSTGSYLRVTDEAASAAVISSSRKR
jgi:integrase